jgi:hypothetical protein
MMKSVTDTTLAAWLDACPIDLPDFANGPPNHAEHYLPSTGIDAEP